MTSLLETESYRAYLEYRRMTDQPKPPMPETMAERDETLSGWNDRTWEWQSLVDLFALGEVTPGYLQDHLLDAWTSVEFPLQYNGSGRGRWGVVPAMFRHAGFVTDGTMETPTEPITIYRGCPVFHLKNMSWTTDLDRARWFANRYNYNEHAIVVATMVVDPDRILGVSNDRKESEVIIDPRRFDWSNVSTELLQDAS